MATGYRDDAGEFVTLFPSHDPDKQDEGLALEVAEMQALDELIAAVRRHLRHYTAHCKCDACSEDRAAKLPDALEAYDAAVQANREHDSTL